MVAVMPLAVAYMARPGRCASADRAERPYLRRGLFFARQPWKPWKPHASATYFLHVSRVSRRFLKKTL